MRKKTTLATILAMLALLLAAAAAPAVAQEGGSKTISVKQGSLEQHPCNASEWQFIINQIAEESLAPTSITVMWSNGSSTSVGLSQFGGGAAHYRTSANLDAQLTNATATIYAEWDGEFVLSHGPCVAASPSPTGTPTGTATPTATPPGSPTPSPTVAGETASPAPTVAGETASPAPTGTAAPTGPGSESPAPTVAGEQRSPGQDSAQGALPSTSTTGAPVSPALLTTTLLGFGAWLIHRRRIGD